MFDFTCFPSLLRIEREVVRMTASLLGGNEETVGNFTYGGTESIMLAMKALQGRSSGRRREKMWFLRLFCWQPPILLSGKVQNTWE